MARLAASSPSEPFDVLVVGAGINGAVSAACLAGRGARVALVDRGDFAGFTSQESSNLAWGGIKYMESFELGLVRKLCVSRNHLIRSYPSTVREIRFLAVHQRGFRHGLWKLVLGTFLYWLLGSFFTKRPRRHSVESLASTEPILELSTSDGGFEYSDAYLHDNDARFVWSFIRSAMDNGCAVANYVEVTDAKYEGGIWRVEARDVETGEALTVHARSFVNACGPFVDALNAKVGAKTRHRHVFSKGIHLIVPRLTKQMRVLTFFADDGRPFFVIPMGPCSSIGTTDTPVDEPYTEPTDDDRRFVLDNVNKRLRLKKPLDMSDVVAERCGVRPLAVAAGGSEGTDWMQLSRKHVVEVDAERRQVSIFGGKLTDCLNVGDEVADALRDLDIAQPNPRARWYGEAPDEVRDEFLQKAAALGLDEMTSPRSSEALTTRLWRRYGAEALPMLDAIREDRSMAEVIIEGAEYLRCEIAHAARREMIVELDDFLRRRSKIALVIGRDELEDAPGLREACIIFFGDRADAKMKAYFDAHPSSAKS
ncbi:MAG: glycerol-3-phosphate dehydrogenase/oxidase [Polyangiaceae bacterium]|nr:glycerol-3-phosphate dehydrogenase/oxidase [Polyangiaceae bacterium]